MEDFEFRITDNYIGAQLIAGRFECRIVIYSDPDERDTSASLSVWTDFGWQHVRYFPWNDKFVSFGLDRNNFHERILDHVERDLRADLNRMYIWGLNWLQETRDD